MKMKLSIILFSVSILFISCSHSSKVVMRDVFTVDTSEQSDARGTFKRYELLVSKWIDAECQRLLTFNTEVFRDGTFKNIVLYYEGNGFKYYKTLYLTIDDKVYQISSIDTRREVVSGDIVSEVVTFFPEKELLDIICAARTVWIRADDDVVTSLKGADLVKLQDFISIVR